MVRDKTGVPSKSRYQKIMWWQNGNMLVCTRETKINIKKYGWQKWYLLITVRANSRPKLFIYIN